MAVVLQADVTRPGHVLVCVIEFVRRPVRVLVSLLPAVQIHGNDLMTVQQHRDCFPPAGDRVAIPFPGRLHRIHGWRQIIKYRPAVFASHLLLPVRIQHLHFDGRVEPFLDVPRPEKNAAVGVFVKFELQVQDEVAVTLFCPDVATCFSSKPIRVNNSESRL